MDIAALNIMDTDAARRALQSCCGSGAWVDRMLGMRPFRDTTSLLTTAEETWWDLGTGDWIEGFEASRESAEEYESRFGFPYVVHANGRTTSELDELYRSRLESEPVTELQAAAVEQARITNRRLRELLGLV